MNEDAFTPPISNDRTDAKIDSDWEAVLERLADISSRSGGNARRQAILERLGILKQAS